MTKELKDKISQERLAFKDYAEKKLNEAYPNHSVSINYISTDTNSKRRWLTAYIGNELAFGGGTTNYEAVENLISTFQPKTPEQKSRIRKNPYFKPYSKIL